MLCDLSNMIKRLTCFTSGNTPSLVDDILTNSTSCADPDGAQKFRTPTPEKLHKYRVP